MKQRYCKGKDETNGMNHESEWCFTNTTGPSCFALYSTQNLEQEIIESMKLGQKIKNKEHMNIREVKRKLTT